MEAYLLKDQMRNPRNYNHPLISHPSENFAPLNSHGGGLFYAPPHPSLSYSYPPSVQYYHNRQQPPLLPLPIPIPNQQNFNSFRARGLSCPPVNRKIKNKNTPAQRKSKPNAKTTLENNPVITVDSKPNAKTTLENNPVITVDSPIANRFGPELTNLPSSRVLLSNYNNNNIKKVVVVKKQVDEFSGSVVYTDISPPPSSLPLPTFFLRPKLSCNVEAAVGVDDGATNDLRSLLRLR